MAAHLEAQPAAVDLDELDLGRDLHTDRRRRAVADLDPGPDRALLRREVGGERGDAGPFDKGNHLGGGEDRRHLSRPAEEMPGCRHGERIGDPDRRAVAQPGLQIV